MSDSENSIFLSRPRTGINRLNKYELEEARTHRLKHLRMWIVTREILSYLYFLWTIYTLTYSNRNSNAFVQHDYTKITTINEYWSWLENSFVENIRAQKWYNNKLSTDLRGFTNDKFNRLIGWTTVRQVRVKSETCKAQSTTQLLNITCESDYDLFNEDQRTFQPGWINENHTTINYSSSIRNAYLYRTSKQLNTYIYISDHKTYGSGEYVNEIRGLLTDIQKNLSTLQKLGWIDEKTRAVIIQCTLYNPNAQLFTSVTFLAEFLPIGGMLPTARFEPIHLQGYFIILSL
ncbi:hypothetical protein I4U23_020153 [Adineta vaga]|nr:hypothetical protein I4U23_020153 [Adineta vaga]